MHVWIRRAFAVTITNSYVLSRAQPKRFSETEGEKKSYLVSLPSCIERSSSVRSLNIMEHVEHILSNDTRACAV